MVGSVGQQADRGHAGADRHARLAGDGPPDDGFVDQAPAQQAELAGVGISTPAADRDVGPHRAPLEQGLDDVGRLGRQHGAAQPEEVVRLAGLGHPGATPPLEVVVGGALWGRLVPFEEHDLVALPGREEGRRQAAEAAADHHDLRHPHLLRTSAST